MSMRRPYPSDPSLTNMSSNGYHHHQLRTNEMIESQNDHLMEEMSSKVKQLRSLSINIGEEVRNQNNELQGMGEDFEGASGLLGSSMKRVKGMASAGHNRWMLYMILFIVIVFFLLYYIIRWRTHFQ